MPTSDSDSANRAAALAEIKERIRSRVAGVKSEGKPESEPPPQILADLGVLRHLSSELKVMCAQIGTMPPQPPTLRARMGATLVRLTQRMLFWYTPQIRISIDGIARVFEQYLNKFEEFVLFDRQEKDLSREEITGLRTRIAGLESRVQSREQNFQERIAEYQSRAQNFQERIAEYQSRAQNLEEKINGLQVSFADALRKTTFELQQILQHYFSREVEEVREGCEKKISTETLKLQQAFNERLRRELYGYELKLSAESAKLEQNFDVKLHRERETLVSSMEFCRLKQDLAEQARRVSVLLEEVRKALPEPSGASRASALAEELQHHLDSIYLSFEDIFRGNRADIKQRLEAYLPLLKETGAGAPDMPILDVGCGRGEWLELLRAQSWKARGMDINRSMLAECRSLGLDVEEGDVLDYLKAQPAASLGAVTGFHIVEHLPFDVLIALLDEVVRVLKPGGIAIFETPNPENLSVLSRLFYLDPTHRNPIPSHTLKFLVEARGLCRVEVVQLNPFDASFLVQDQDNELARRFNSYFYGPQDYAVVGRKV